MGCLSVPDQRAIVPWHGKQNAAIVGMGHHQSGISGQEGAEVKYKMDSLARHHHLFGRRLRHPARLIREDAGCIDDAPRCNRVALATLAIRRDHTFSKPSSSLVSSVTPV